MGSMHEVSQALASPAAWEEPDRAARLAPRLPEETGLPPSDAEELLRLCEESADPDSALAGAVRALAARRARLGHPASAGALLQRPDQGPVWGPILRLGAGLVLGAAEALEDVRGASQALCR